MKAKKKLHRRLSILLCCVLVLGLMPITAFAADPSTAPTYSGGSGTEADPYLLSCKEDILALQEYLNSLDDYARAELDKVDDCGLGSYHGYYFKLTKDIDMSDVEDWVPFSFCGTLDGAGYTISNLQLNQNFFESANPGNNEYKSQQYEAGFFSQLIHAHIKNLYFENCTATVSDGLKPESERDIYAAVVAGTAIASSFENISVVNCTVTQNGEPTNFGYAAGLVAYADICHISNCSVQGGSINVGGDATKMYTGGLVGAFGDVYDYYKDYYNMTVGAGNAFGVYNCFSTAAVNVTCTNYRTGGLIGMIECLNLADTYENCMVGGTITSAAYAAAGLIGTCDSYINTTVKGCVVYSDSIQGGTYADPLYRPYSDSYDAKITVTNCKVSHSTEVKVSNTDTGSVTNNASLTPVTLAEADCQVPNFKSNLHGKLVDGSANVTITLSQDNEVKYTAKTDADGEYNFGKQVLMGTYTLDIAEVKGYEAYSETVTIGYAVNVEKDITRTAKLIFVTLNANGGECETTSLTTGADGKLTSLPTPTRVGYIFDGWYMEIEDSTQVTENTEFSENTTIYAHWTECDHSASVNQPTCDNSATCSVCGGTMPAKGHHLIKVEPKDATCTEAGNIAYWTCSSCGKWLADPNHNSVVIPSLGHDYATTWSRNADKHWHECSYCGDKADTTAHSFKWVVDKEATATEKGSKHEECEVCGYKKAAVEIPATGNTTDPTQPTNPTNPGETNPDTGDSSIMWLWFALLLVSGTCIAGVTVYHKRRKAE